MWISKLKGPTLLFIFVVIAIWHGAAQDCIIYESPKTIVTRKNTTVKFNCHVDAYGEDIFLIFNHQINSWFANKEYYARKGIVWSCSGMKCKLSVFASEENDGLLVNCGFANCITEDAHIFAVDGIPSPPKPPTVEIHNSTFINISWSPPWKYPVNRYTVMITDLKKKITVMKSTRAKYILNKADNTVCEALQIRVSADTDIGSTGFGNETVKGLPKAMEYEQPLTTVALLNTTVTVPFHSRCTSDELMYLKINQRIVDIDQMKKEGITWEVLYCDATKTKIGYILSISATKKVNGTIIQCLFPQCNSETRKFIVVEKLPNTPNHPIITELSRTSLNISWISPWSHPVNRYTLFIYNMNRDGSVIKYNTENTFYVFKNEGKHECDQFSFSVQAETDVGVTGISNKSYYQFYRGVQADQVQSTKSYTFCKGIGKEISLHISFQPSICSSESPSYHYELTNERSNDVLRVETENIPAACFKFNGSLLATDLLRVELVVSNIAHQNLTLTMFTDISFHEVYFSELDGMLYLESTTGSNETEATCESTISLTKAGFIGLSFFAILIASFCFTCYFYLKCSSKRKVPLNERNHYTNMQMKNLQNQKVDIVLENTGLSNTTGWLASENYWI